MSDVFKVGEIVHGIMPKDKDMYYYSSVGTVAKVIGKYNDYVDIKIIESPWKELIGRQVSVRKTRLALRTPWSKEDKFAYHMKRVENRHLLPKKAQ